MIDPISLTTLSIQNDTQRMNVIANNAANALTSGFKREYLVASGQLDSGLVNSGSSEGILAFAPALRSVIDNRAGVAKQTGNALDIALLGEGYFEVKTENGLAYTRQGNFRVDEKNRLVTQSGFPVSGITGDIFLTSTTPSIDKSGKIFEQGKQVAQIKIVKFDASAILSNIGGGLVTPARDAAQQEMLMPRMAQGKVESSNVDSTQEMVRMLETFRHFETSHRVLQAYDEMNDKALRNLGQF